MSWEKRYLACARIALMLGVVGSLSACVSQTAVLSGYTPPATVAPFEIVDQRPAKERDTRFLSLLITSCDYSVRQAGDSATVPDRVTLLRDDLNAALGAQLANKSLVLTHYTVHFNNANAMRNQVYGANGGLVAGVMKGFGSRCKREEMEAGWFGPDDVTTPYSPFIVEITLSVDGKSHDVRSVYSPDKEVAAGFGDPNTAVALFAAIQQATQKLVVSLRET